MNTNGYTYGYLNGKDRKLYMNSGDSGVFLGSAKIPLQQAPIAILLKEAKTKSKMLPFLFH